MRRRRRGFGRRNMQIYDAERGCLRSARARGRDDTMIGGGERGVRHGPHSLSQLRTEGTSRIGMSRCRCRRIVSRWHATRHGGRPVPHGSVRSDRRIVVLPSSSPSRRSSFAADHLDADARCDVGRHRRAGATRPGWTIARQDARHVRGVAPIEYPPPPLPPPPPPSPPRRWHTLPILRVHRGSHAACSLPRVHVGVRPGRGHRRRKFGFRGGARLRDAIARNVIVVVVNVIRGGRGLCTDTRHRRSRRVAMAHDGGQIVVATARVRGRVLHRRRSWDEKRRRCRDDVREHIRRGGMEARCGVLRQRRAIDRPIFEERRRGGGGGGVPAPRR